MSSASPNLNQKQELAVLSLARGGDVETAAAAAGVSPRTVVRWRTNDEFQQAVFDVRRDIHSQAIGAIVDSLITAVKALTDIAGDSKSPTSSRVSAAKTLLDSAYRAIEGEELEARLLKLEVAFQEYQKL